MVLASVLAAVVVPAAMPGVVRSHVTLVRPVGGVGRRRVAVRLVSAVWRVGAGSGRVPELRVAAAVSVLLHVSAVPVPVAMAVLRMSAAVPVLVGAVPVLSMAAVPVLVALAMAAVALLVALYMATAVAVPLAV